ncbi:flagellar protein FlaG [Pseudomonas sp. MMS21-TM103]|uniref:flagellar protein FlaG n=1 Tax=Pseudomonas sp. MMS21 TM103 TaxID=2886506 RepID=UPI001EE0827C|nr:flagellar protein FlaG [Pseudomonas sp. MMS21 TM103]MCG4453709.1 flagellar protein FlaG [Pseudomonas sp. MMS21 TM103]
MDIGINSSLSASLSKATAAATPVSPVAAAAKAAEIDSAVSKKEPEEATQSREPVEDAVIAIQSFVQSIRRDLNFSLDDSSGRVVVKVTDGASGEVIRQLPSEEALRLAESLEEVRSLLFKAEA